MCYGWKLCTGRSSQTKIENSLFAGAGVMQGCDGSLVFLFGAFFATVAAGSAYRPHFVYNFTKALLYRILTK